MNPETAIFIVNSITELLVSLFFSVTGIYFTILIFRKITGI